MLSDAGLKAHTHRHTDTHTLLMENIHTSSIFAILEYKCRLV